MGQCQSEGSKRKELGRGLPHLLKTENQTRVRTVAPLGVIQDYTGLADSVVPEGIIQAVVGGKNHRS